MEKSKLQVTSERSTMVSVWFGQDLPQLRAAWTNSDIYLERRIRRSTAKRKQATIPRQEEGELSLAQCEIQVEAPVVVANLAEHRQEQNHDLQASFPTVPDFPKSSAPKACQRFRLS